MLYLVMTRKDTGTVNLYNVFQHEYIVIKKFIEYEKEGPPFMRATPLRIYINYKALIIYLQV